MSNLLNPNAKGSLEEAVEEVETPEEEQDALDLLRLDFGDLIPERSIIEGWKAMYGGVNCYIPSADEFFMFRSLKRLEHRNISRDMQRLQESASAEQDPTIVEDQLHERVVQACILLPSDLMSADRLNNAPAGLFRTLFNLIMEHSHFVAPERALASCIRL
jgi:hypothetical protein